MGESSWKEQRRGLNNSPLQLHSRDVKQILCQRSWLFAVNNHLSIFLFILSLLLYLSSLKHPIASITQVTLVTLVISVILYEDCNAPLSKHRKNYHMTQHIHVPRRPCLYFRILAHHLLFNTKLYQLCHSEQKHCYPWRICEFIGVQSKSEYLANVGSVTGCQDEDKGVVIQHSLLPTGRLSALMSFQPTLSQPTDDTLHPNWLSCVISTVTPRQVNQLRSYFSRNRDRFLPLLWHHQILDQSTMQ